MQHFSDFLVDSVINRMVTSSLLRHLDGNPFVVSLVLKKIPFSKSNA